MQLIIETPKRAERRQQTIRAHKRKQRAMTKTFMAADAKPGRKHSCNKAQCIICHEGKVTGKLNHSTKKRIQSSSYEH